MPTFAPLLDLSQRIADELRARQPYGRLPPGPPEPALAQTLAWIARPVEFLERGHARYGDVFTMRLLGVDPFVTVRDPDILREVFTGPPELLRAGEANVVLEPIVGSSSVLLLDGARHMSQRRLLLPPFHGQRMRAYGAIIRDATLRAMAAWPRRRAFPFHERAQAITLDVILRAVFGVEDARPLRALDETLSSLLERLANPIWLLPLVQADLGPLSPGGRLARLLERVDALIYALVRERRAEDRTGREDILTMLLEARHEDGSPMSDVELRDELVTLLVAGHETTATSLAWTLHRLLDAPEVLREVVAEVARVFPDGRIDPERVGELRYLDAVIKETLRMNPVVPLVGRRLQAPMRFDRLELPEGVVVVPAIYSTHHNPRVWPDPERFDPSRFLGTKPSPYAFFPFGGGVRRCIGMAFALYEMQVVLATVLAKLRVRRPEGPPVRLVRRAITFAPSHGMPLSVEDRSDRGAR